MDYFPSYIELYKNGELEKRINKLFSFLASCKICPHHCKVDRFHSKDGYCSTGVLPIVASYNAHFGEEPPITGYHGSGTIFFSNCNLKCMFCQNCDISQLHHGREISYDDLSTIMIDLQNKGCHNINLVTPTHIIHAILNALPKAIEKGLKIPLVYNSGGYDSPEIISMLEGIIDIYMPDVKYMDEKLAYRLSKAKRYPQIAKMVIYEMYRQVGDLQTNELGIATKGLLIRHLILPGYICNSKGVMDFLKTVSPNLYVNIMDQYHPEYLALQDNNLTRRITLDEYNEVVEYAKNIGMQHINIA